MSETKTITIEKLFDVEGKKPLAIVDEEGQRYVTFKAPVQEVLRANENKRGILTYSVEEKNGYTNTYAEGFEPILGTVDAELTNRSDNGKPTAGPVYRQPTHPLDAEAIARAVALDKAVLYSAGAEDRTAIDVMELAKLFEAHLKRD